MPLSKEEQAEIDAWNVRNKKDSAQAEADRVERKEYHVEQARATNERVTSPKDPDRQKEEHILAPTLRKISGGVRKKLGE